MARWKITIEYAGAKYSGWQIQPEQKTVQGEIENSLEKLFNKKITIQGAGRTDSGVNATGQVAHFDVESNFDKYKMEKALKIINNKKLGVLIIKKTNGDTAGIITDGDLKRIAQKYKKKYTYYFS